MAVAIRPEKQEFIKQRLKEVTKGWDTLDEQAKFLSVSVGTLRNFLGGGVHKVTFEQICRDLGVDDWWEVADFSEQVRAQYANKYLAEVTRDKPRVTDLPTSPLSSEIAQKERGIPLNFQIPASSKVTQFVPRVFGDYVEERTRFFSGRTDVFKTIKELIDNNQSGYFTVTGSPGSGKTAILSKYVMDEEARKKEGIKCVSYFNIRSEGKESERECLESICSSIISTFNLNPDILTDRTTRKQYRYNSSDPLRAVIYDASRNLGENEKLVIVIDALDELDLQNADKKRNILYLPESLPNRVYFLLSRRPYEKHEERLPTNPIKKKIDLDASEYKEDGRRSIIDYLEKVRSANDDPSYKGKLDEFIDAISISWEEFVEIIVERSQLNFMYVRQVVRAFADGMYRDMDIRELPEGLEAYYERHWMKMRIKLSEVEDRNLRSLILNIRLSVLFLLSTSVIKLSEKTILKNVLSSIQKNKNIDPLQVVIDSSEVASHVDIAIGEWFEFLKEYKEKDKERTLVYCIYHYSFCEFIKLKLESFRMSEEAYENFVTSHITI